MSKIERLNFKNFLLFIGEDNGYVNTFIRMNFLVYACVSECVLYE